MNVQASRERWQHLAEAGIATGPAIATPSHPPLTIVALVGLAAWLAALFLLFFIGMAFEDALRRPEWGVVIGAIVCGVTVPVLRRAGHHRFAAQLALAFSLAGQALVVFGLVADAQTSPWRWSLVVVFEALLALSVPLAVHRILTTLASALALLVMLSTLAAAPLFLPLVLAAFVATQQRLLRAAAHPALWHTLAIALALALLVAVAHAALPELWRPRDAPPGPLAWLAVLAQAVVSAWAGLAMADDATGTWRSRPAALAATTLAALAVAAFPLPGVAAMVVMLLLGFATGYRVTMALAAIGLLGALAHAYYQLDATLLAKAGGLCAIGVLLMLARIALDRVWPTREAADA